MISDMTYQMDFWLVRSGSSLRLCAEIPSRGQLNDCDSRATVVTHDSPGAFFSRLDTTLFEQEKLEQIKTVENSDTIKFTVIGSFEIPQALTSKSCIR